ncbi:DUF948 domain-containing protein [Paenibacillus koleovorans]|uniref:DUF948 domain-containing protein n=1 Tax=Paenibacillus koleovorans TaxID=121608 RepID=UPI000FD85E95|nr:DUF948 domain-containing protein [Paenibacillus koleovorans]
MLWQISLTVIALAFVILVYFLIQTLKTVQGSLEEVRNTMVQMKGELAQVSAEVKDVLFQTNMMAVDVRTKLNELDPLFHSVGNVGSMLQELTTSVRQTASTVTTAIQNGSRQVVEKAPVKGKIGIVMKGIPVVVELWKQIQNKRAQGAAANTIAQ